MMSAVRLKLQFSLLAVAMALTAAASGFAQQAGLDVVMLVDVSASMSPDGDNPGNDPEQLRWDAVKLVLDLLTDDDRLLVLPFSEQCPAASAPLESQDLEYARSDYQKKLGRQIEAFIPDRGAAVTTDDGGTGIIAALEVARGKIEAASKSPRESARPKVVFLLTDGQQNTNKLPLDDTPDDRLVNNPGEAWKSDERVTYFRDNKIPIYTFGLGQQAEMTFLEELAKFTNATPMKVDSNTQLVERFRELIWSVGRCFVTAPFDAQQPSRRSGSLGGAVDFAVLLYEQLPGAESLKRRSAAPNPLPARRWLNAPEPPAEDVRTGKRMELPGSTTPRESGYAIVYYDGRRTQRDLRGSMFQAAPQMELELGFPAESRRSNLTGYFIKRMAVEFDVRLTKGALGKEGEYYRNEPIPLEVEVRASGGGEVAKRFEISAELVPTDAALAGTSPIALAASPDRPTLFRPAGLTAVGLSPSTELYDTCVLKITVTEKTAAGGLAYAHTLPPRLVTIKNAIPLRHVPPSVMLSPAQPRVDIHIGTLQDWPQPTNFRLNVARMLPKQKSDSKTFPAGAIDFDTAELKSGALTLHGNRGKIGLQLAADQTKWPQQPGLYEDGSLLLTSVDSRLRIVTLQPGGVEEPGYEIPWGFRRAIVGLKLDAQEGSEWSVGPAQSQDRRKLVVSLADAKEAPPDGFTVTVSLASADDKKPLFSPQEFWIQAAGEAAVAKDRRQSIALKSLGEEFDIFFQPDLAKHADHAGLIGTHAYVVRAAGEGFDRPELPISLAVLRPELEFKRVGAPISQAAPGVAAPVQMQARLIWLANGKLPLNIEPAAKIRLTVADEGAGKQAGRAAFDVPYTGGSRSVELVSPADLNNPASGWTNLDFQFQIPDDFRHGSYAGSLALLFHDEPLAPELPFAFRINSLTSTGLIISEAQRKKFADIKDWPEPTPVESVSVVQFFDRGATVQLNVRCDLNGVALDPSKLVPQSADAEFPFLTNAKDARDYVAAPKLKQIASGAMGGSLVVDLLLPPVRNATPGVPYNTTLDFEYRDPEQSIDLGRLSITLEVTFVDPQAVLQVEPATEAKPQEE